MALSSSSTPRRNSTSSALSSSSSLNYPDSIISRSHGGADGPFMMGGILSYKKNLATSKRRYVVIARPSCVDHIQIVFERVFQAALLTKSGGIPNRRSNAEDRRHFSALRPEQTPDILDPKVCAIYGNIAKAAVEKTPLMIILTSFAKSITPTFIHMSTVDSFYSEVDLSTPCHFRIRVGSDELRFVAETSHDYQEWEDAIKEAMMLANEGLKFERLSARGLMRNTGMTPSPVPSYRPESPASTAYGSQSDSLGRSISAPNISAPSTLTTYSDPSTPKHRPLRWKSSISSFFSRSSNYQQPQPRSAPSPLPSSTSSSTAYPSPYMNPSEASSSASLFSNGEMVGSTPPVIAMDFGFGSGEEIRYSPGRGTPPRAVRGDTGSLDDVQPNSARNSKYFPATPPPIEGERGQKSSMSSSSTPQPASLYEPLPYAVVSSGPGATRRKESSDAITAGRVGKPDATSSSSRWRDSGMGASSSAESTFSTLSGDSSIRPTDGQGSVTVDSIYSRLYDHSQIEGDASGSSRPLLQTGVGALPSSNNIAMGKRVGPSVTANPASRPSPKPTSLRTSISSTGGGGVAPSSPHPLTSLALSTSRPSQDDMDSQRRPSTSSYHTPSGSPQPVAYYAPQMYGYPASAQQQQEFVVQQQQQYYQQQQMAYYAAAAAAAAANQNYYYGYAQVAQENHGQGYGNGGSGAGAIGGKGGEGA
ncbi:hypothetical protein HDU67_001678 [Dinochytrium kinnereticum]|nr:hypothetical protein HDU67_001678 [Dinochytrium kinnereticum]